MARVRCNTCRGDGADPEATWRSCRDCGGIGSVLACATCQVEPRDPLFAPACSGTCRELYDRSQPQPIVRRAP